MTIAFLHQLIWICFTRVALARFFASVDSVPPVEHNAPANPLFKRSIQVRLPYGTFYGSENKQVRYFLGIPYAQPPVGKMRFERPRPPIRKLGLQDATRFGAGCFQDPIAPPLNGIRLNKSESCLNANVWAPSGHSSNDDPIPVLVWVLPGGFTSGYSSNPLYDGSAVIKNSKEKVMVVSFDYRMGIFGWPADSSFRKERKLNLGLHDNIAAFKWVRNNIHRFGGDPTRITAFGESAGAIIIASLLLIHGGTQDLFDQAIIESGTGGYTLPTVQDKQASFHNAIREAGCEPSSDARKEIACLTKLKPEILANNSVTDLFEPFPMVDGDLLVEQPIDAIKKGLFSRVPVMLGTTTNEGTFFAAGKVKSHAEIPPLLKYLLPFLTDEDIDEIMNAYSTSPFAKDAYLLGSQIVGDRFFQCPSTDLAQALAEQNVTVYKYRWNHAPELLRYFNFYGGKLGIFHFSEVPFIFSARPLYASREEYRLSDAAIRAWVSFAKTGVPVIESVTLAEKEAWPTYKVNDSDSDETTRQNLVFQTPVSSIFTESDAYREQYCAIWRDIEQRTHSQIAVFQPIRKPKAKLQPRFW